MSRRERVASRLRAEATEAGERRPRLRAAWHWFVRHRLWFVAGAALVVAFLDGRGSFEIQDPGLFVHAGKKLLSLHPLDAFADKAVQEGPLALVFWGLVGRLSSLIGVEPRMIASLAIYVGFTVAMVLLVRRSLEERDRPSADLELFATAIVLAAGLTWTMLSTGHVAEGFIPLLWFQAARDARGDRAQRSAVWIVLATGLKLWGILGSPILLLWGGRDRRAFLRAGATTVGISALLYSYLALGATAQLHYRWEIADTSLIHKLFSGSSTFSWEMRVAQSSVVVLVGAGLALLIGRRQRADWAVPLGIIGTKLLLDPIVFEYYSLSIAVVALLAAGLAVKKWPPWLRLPGAALIYLGVYPSWLLEGNALGGIALLIAVAACVEAYRLRRARALEPG